MIERVTTNSSELHHLLGSYMTEDQFGAYMHDITTKLIENQKNKSKDERSAAESKQDKKLSEIKAEITSLSDKV